MSKFMGYENHKYLQKFLYVSIERLVKRFAG